VNDEITNDCENIFWFDAGLSHTGLIPPKHLVENKGYWEKYYESPLFNNVFLKNLIEYSDNKVVVCAKENINNLTIALKYVRLSSLTKIEDIADFVQYNWKLDLRSPKLLISVLNSKIQRNEIDTTTNEENIKDKNKLIEQIKKEKDVETIYKLYIEMIGKKGINKLVLRSVLPIINSELQRLLDDVTDFEVEISISLSVPFIIP
jgi:hypothetical protein